MTTRNTFLRLCCPPGPNAVRWTARVGPAEVGRELCTHLQGLGIRVWFDEVVIEPGASQALNRKFGARMGKTYKNWFGTGEDYRIYVLKLGE